MWSAVRPCASLMGTAKTRLLIGTCFGTLLLLLPLIVDGHSMKKVKIREDKNAVERDGSVEEESGDLVKRRMARDTDAVNQQRAKEKKGTEEKSSSPSRKKQTEERSSPKRNEKKQSKTKEKRSQSRRNSKVKGRREKASSKAKSKKKMKKEKRKSKNKTKRKRKPAKKYGKKKANKKKSVKRRKPKERKRKWRMIQRRKKQRKRGKVIKDQSDSWRGEEATCVSTTCLNLAMSSMELMGSKVVNFQRQVKRIVAKRSIGEKKTSKSGIFKPALNHLIELGGGNLSNPVCSGSSNNQGSQQIKNLSATLADCEENINALCDPSNMPEVNFTLVESCKRSMNMFEGFVAKCSALPETEACSCWSGDKNSTETIAAVQKCDLGDLPRRTRFALADCKSAFGRCRKSQDDVASIMFACSQDPGVLKQKLKNLVQNKEAVDQVQTKISSLIKRNSRAKRQDDASTATGFIRLCLEVTMLVADTPNDHQIFVYSTLIIASNLTKFTSNDLASLATITTKLTVAITMLDQEISVAVSTIFGNWI